MSIIKALKEPMLEAFKKSQIKEVTRSMIKELATSIIIALMGSIGKQPRSRCQHRCLVRKCICMPRTSTSHCRIDPCIDEGAYRFRLTACNIYTGAS